ncbi:MAG: hypothetical protein AAGF23_24290 [Acidobacteriota bacterium]
MGGWAVVVTAERVAPGLGATPRFYLARRAHGPPPTPDPCMPCTGGWDDEPGGGGLLSLEDRVLHVNITDSAGVPDDLTLVGLRLMINRGAQLFTLAPVEMSSRVFLEQVSGARIDQLVVTHLSDDVYGGDELNLIYLYEQTSPSQTTGENAGWNPSATDENGPAAVYWSATPIDVDGP